jgi:hypothetical protein
VLALRNHAPHIAAMDLFVVPSIGFNLLYNHHRQAGPEKPHLGQRDDQSTAEWIARQLSEAFPWHEAMHYVIRDRDRIFEKGR